MAFKLERKKCDTSSRSSHYSYRYSYTEWMAERIEEATVNIYKFQADQCLRRCIIRDFSSFFFFFSAGEKVKFPWTWLGTRGKWTSFVRISFHERWSFEARVHRSTFHSEYLLENSSEFSDSNEPRHSARHVERGLIRCLEYRIASTHTLKILADKINTLIYLYIYIYIAPFLKSLADCHFSILYLVAF